MLRQPTPADYEACLALDHSVSSETVWQMNLQESGEINLSFRPARMPRSIKVAYPRSGETLVQSWRQGAYFVVARAEDAVVGYANVGLDLSGASAWLRDLCVDGSQRLRGIGGVLLRASRQWAVEQQLNSLIVETQTKNSPAIQFLQARGFRFCGYNEYYYPSRDIALFFAQTLS